MTFPKTITFKSDGNELELQETPKPTKGCEQAGVYIYRKSNTKKDQLLSLTVSQLEKLLSNQSIDV